MSDINTRPSEFQIFTSFRFQRITIGVSESVLKCFTGINGNGIEVSRIPVTRNGNGNEIIGMRWIGTPIVIPSHL